MALQHVNGGRERHSRVMLIFGGEKKLNLVVENKSSERYDVASNQRDCIVEHWRSNEPTGLLV